MVSWLGMNWHLRLKFTILRSQIFKRGASRSVPGWLIHIQGSLYRLVLDVLLNAKLQLPKSDL